MLGRRAPHRTWPNGTNLMLCPSRRGSKLLPAVLVLLASMAMLLAACAAPEENSPLMAPTPISAIETPAPLASSTADMTSTPSATVIETSTVTAAPTHTVAAGTATPTITTTPTFTATPEFTPTPSVPLAVPLSEINVRSGPGTNYDVATKALKDQQLLIVGQFVVGTEHWLQVAAEAQGIVGFVRSDLVKISGQLSSVPELPAADIPPTPTRAPTATMPPAATTEPAKPTIEAPIQPTENWFTKYARAGAGPYEVTIVEGTNEGDPYRGVESFQIKTITTTEAIQRGDKYLILVTFTDGKQAAVYLRGTPNTITNLGFPINGFCVADKGEAVCDLDFSITAHDDIFQYVQAVAVALKNQTIGFNNAGDSIVSDATYTIITQALADMLRSF